MNSEIKKVLFIVNKFSGPGYQQDLEGNIMDECARQDVEGRIEFTANSGHATAIATEAAAGKSADLVVAVGGDGTVNEVAAGLLHSSVPMGIIPKGSGNGLARHLGIPMKMRAALNVLFESQLIAMDSFKINGKLSLNVSGIGFDGHVANLFAGNKKRGLKGYAKVTINEFFAFKEFEATIKSERETIQRKAFVIAIANSSQYGNNARIAPAASVRDGILHVCFLKKVPPYRLDFIYNFFNGKISNSSFCEFIETKDLEITVDKPVAFHIDGEACGVNTQFRIEMVPQSLRMFVPKTSLKY